MSSTVEEALRRSHCARVGESHGCAGTLTVTARGVLLSCPLCGDGGSEAPATDSRIVERAKHIVEAAGVRWASLSIDAQRAACDEVARDHCPGCRRVRTPGAHSECACGAWRWSEYFGWQARNAAEVQATP